MLGGRKRASKGISRDGVRSVAPSAVGGCVGSGSGRERARCGLRVRIHINFLYYCIRIRADHSPLASMHLLRCVTSMTAAAGVCAA